MRDQRQPKTTIVFLYLAECSWCRSAESERIVCTVRRTINHHFYRDVLPMPASSCQSCHPPGARTAMRFETYEEQGRAGAIARARRTNHAAVVRRP